MATHFCPEYEDAVHSELRDRVNALAGKPETIAGIAAKLLTPRLWDILAANHSPFVIGGKITSAAILQFLWITSVGFEEDKPGQDWIEQTALTINYFEASAQIDGYLERTFMDSNDGKPSVPYYPLSVALIHQMACKPYRWTKAQTYDTSFREIFLLLRPVQQSLGVPLINKRSDAIMQEAVEEIDRKMKSGEWTQTDLDRINRDNLAGSTNGR